MNKKTTHNCSFLNDEFYAVQFVVNGIIERSSDVNTETIVKIVTENYRKEQRRRKRKERKLNIENRKTKQ